MLGEGLSGGLASTEGAAPPIEASIEDVFGAAVAPELVDFALLLVLERLETGSNVTMRALGGRKWCDVDVFQKVDSSSAGECRIHGGWSL